MTTTMSWQGRAAHLWRPPMRPVRALLVLAVVIVGLTGLVGALASRSTVSSTGAPAAGAASGAQSAIRAQAGTPAHGSFATTGGATSAGPAVTPTTVAAGTAQGGASLPSLPAGATGQSARIEETGSLTLLVPDTQIQNDIS